MCNTALKFSAPRSRSYMFSESGREGPGYPQRSLPLMLPGRSGEPQRLRIFESMSTLAAPADESLQAEDVLLFAGGPVWALAWSPALPSDGNDYLAVACHRPGHERHLIGEPAQGPHMLQLWAVPRAAEGQGAVLPWAASLVSHDGDHINALAWCPRAGEADPHRLGLLALSRGDGAVCVYAMSRAQPGTKGAIVDEASVMVAQVDCKTLLGGALPSCLDWDARSGDTLVAGCWDGSALVLRLSGSNIRSAGGAQGLEVLTRIQAGSIALRAVACLPPDDCAEEEGRARGSGAKERSEGHPTAPTPSRPTATSAVIFGTACQDGTMAIWDSRDPVVPQHTQMLTTGCLYAASWSVRPRGLLCACDDGAVRGVPVDAAVVARDSADSSRKIQTIIPWRGAGQGALWGLHVLPGTDLTAYGGEDGVIAVFLAGFQQDARKRRPHQPIGGQCILRGGVFVAVDYW